MADYFPNKKECHCGSPALRYFTRKFVSENNYEVTRIFYKCTNCLSRITDDFVPEIDNLPSIDVFELIKNID